MMIGIKDFIRRGHADDVDACLVPEPEENQLCLSMKGAIRAKVLVTGRMAHGAMPLTGVNPNTRLARIVLAFERFEDRREAPVRGRRVPRPAVGHLHGHPEPPAGQPRAAQRDAR